jgi:hypothetical protein
MTISAQVIDWKNFDTKTMNDVLFTKVSNYITSTTFADKTGNKVQGTAPMKYDVGIKCVCFDKYEAFDKVSKKDVKTYQELADKCIQDWKSDLGYTNTMSLILWSKSLEINCKYKKISQTVNVWLTSRS